MIGHLVMLPFFVIVGAICFAPLLWIQKSNEKRLGTSYTEKLLGVHQVDVISLSMPFEEAFEMCLQSVSSLKFARKIQSDQENGFIRFQTAITIRSFGENVLLAMTEVDSNFTKVVISSKCIVTTTLMDYAKNAENMRIVAGAIQEAEKLSVQKKLIDP